MEHTFNDMENYVVQRRLKKLHAQKEEIADALRQYNEQPLGTELAYLERDAKADVCAWLIATCRKRLHWKTVERFMKKVLMYVKIFLGMYNMAGKSQNYLLPVDLKVLREENIEKIVVDQAILKELIQFIREQCDLMLSLMIHIDLIHIDLIVECIKSMVQAANQRHQPIFFVRTLKRILECFKKVCP